MTILQEEQQRVDQVAAHIEEQLQTVHHRLEENIQNGQAIVRRNQQLKIKDGNEDALRESSFRVKEQEDTLALMEHQVRRHQTQEQQMEKMVDNPYFGRLDVIDEHQHQETFYFGLGAFSYQGQDEIYDWRAPIATLFYNDHLGASTYEVNEQTIPVDVTLKRQFVIKKRHIEVMEDTEQTIGDDVLLTTLSQQSSPHMKNITATIQQEQNKIIRDTHHPYILIQGIAGSGKTAVLLQRLAYLLYHQREFMTSDQVIMFSPNPIFSEYISNVLPSLGEEDVYRVSYEYFLQHLLKGVTFLERDARFKVIYQFMNSEAFIDLMALYFEQLQHKGLQYQNLYRHDGDICFTKQDIATLYKQTNGHTVAQRLEDLQQRLLKELEKQKEAYRQTDAFSMQFNIEAPDLMEKYQREYNTLGEKEKEDFLANKLVDKAFAKAERMIRRKQFIRDDLQYLHFLRFVGQQTKLKQWDDYFAVTRQHLKNNQAYMEDVAIFVYLSQQIKQMRTQSQYKEVMIDEFQDYTPLQLMLIHSLFPTAHYTLCGDGHQLIYQNDTMLHHLETLFHHPVKHYHLTTSYRNTAEIVTFADAILGQQLSNHTMRHGDKPIVWQSSLHELLRQLPPHERSVLIAKDEATCRHWQQQLPTEVKVIDQQKQMCDEGVMLMPLHLAKGLEFDNVIMLDSEEATVAERYTMATRAMHRLYIYSDVPLTWLSKIPASTYTLR